MGVLEFCKGAFSTLSNGKQNFPLSAFALRKNFAIFFKRGVKSRFLTFIRIFGFFWLFLAFFAPFFWLFSTLGPDRYYLRKGVRKKVAFLELFRLWGPIVTI